MAAPLRYALIALSWGLMLLIYLPLIPAAGLLLSPASSLSHWLRLFADPQLPQAILATLVSTLIGVGGALLLALLVIATPLALCPLAASCLSAAVAISPSARRLRHLRPAAFCRRR
ncbi:Inner membrane ABC transporter permease protein ynjC [Kluyvera cryocrescens]|uniref:Inner membrane ABC transporter permease protein ynjC n=1 Tax=Kluyvera cryocrescens TaxID=580 RepID=A0A485AKD1_KLUCR|nr:Inner membrane ABC transporter permease protein ynjC [Kluyvera cryocrescens]